MLFICRWGKEYHSSIMIYTIYLVRTKWAHDSQSYQSNQLLELRASTRAWQSSNKNRLVKNGKLDCWVRDKKGSGIRTPDPLLLCTLSNILEDKHCRLLGFPSLWNIQLPLLLLVQDTHNNARFQPTTADLLRFCQWVRRLPLGHYGIASYHNF